MEETASKIYEYLATYGLNVIAAIIIFFVGRWLAQFVSQLVGRGLVRSNVDKTLAKFTQTLCFVILFTFVIIAALARLGIQTASFIAVVGAGGLAIGLALQGSLANFAAGVLLIIFRPYKVGDFVEIADSSGTVRDIQIFNTILDTLDNSRVIIPNSKVTADKIINLTTNGTRRVDLKVGISYGDDMEKAKHVIEEVLQNDGRVLKDPAPTVAVSDLGDSSVNFAVRPWCKCEDYWGVYFDMTQRIKDALDHNHVTIPFPQRDVHIRDSRREEFAGAHGHREERH